MVGTWLGEIHSCSCLAVLLDTAWVPLNKIYQPFFTSLYILGHRKNLASQHLGVVEARETLLHTKKLQNSLL